MRELPIDPILPALRDTVSRHPVTILRAPPGSGKTTRVPPALLPLFPDGRIVMLEPRRIAALAAARFMASMRGEPVGRTVGYTVRFDSRISPSTRIEVVTEGILSRRMIDDPALSGVSCVVFDEFHERSIHSDTALALCRDIVESLRHDLRIVIMSATLDADRLADSLGGAPVLRADGTTHPVDVRYRPIGAGPLPYGETASVIRRMVESEEGDLLVFLPGGREIRGVERELSPLPGVRITLLHGDLPLERQREAIEPGPVRRVILSTPIAETSLTIEGVRLVIDAGLCRVSRYDPLIGMERLMTVRISRSSAIQRAGRAGRSAPGICIRLYDEPSFRSLVDDFPPEITTSDLSGLVLDLAAGGIADPLTLPWLDPPPSRHLEAARTLLRFLGALDQRGRITPFGREMARLPLHPRVAAFVLRGRDEGELQRCAIVAPLFSGRSPSRELLERSARQIMTLLGERLTAPLPDDPMHLLEELPHLALSGWGDRIAAVRPDSPRRYLLAGGRGGVLPEGSPLAGTPFLIPLEVDGGEGSDAVIHRAVAVDRETVRARCAAAMTESRRVFRDGDRIRGIREERLGGIVLSSSPAPPTDEEAIPLLVEMIRERGISLFGGASEAGSILRRLALVRKTLPGEGLPELAHDLLLPRLTPWLSGVRSAADLASIQLPPILSAIIGREGMERLNRLAPTHVTVPSGRRIPLDYGDEGPVLAVKLQELFGLGETPTVCGGLVAVTIHLLSPAGRPVAVTRDLTGFWERGYPEVRRELRGRYPRHPWPEDPWSAPPTHRSLREGGNR